MSAIARQDGVLEAWQRTLQRRERACAVTDATTGAQTTFAELERMAKTKRKGKPKHASKS